jgi:hypothetical protein
MTVKLVVLYTTAADYAKIAPPGSRMFVESLHD